MSHGFTLNLSEQIKSGPDPGDCNWKPHGHQNGGELQQRSSRSERSEADPVSGRQRNHGRQDAKHQNRPRGHLQGLGEPDGVSDWRGQVWAALCFTFAI